MAGAKHITAYRKKSASGVYARVRFCAFALAFLMLFALCGCAGRDGTQGQQNGSSSLHGSGTVINPRPQDSHIRKPLTLSVREEEGEGYVMRYPNICDDGMELLNLAVRSCFTAFAEENGGSVGYKVCYNDRGLLCFTLFSKDENGGVTAISAADYDCDTAAKFGLSACFGTGSDSYRFTLGDSIIDKVEAQGYSVLSVLPPVDDSRLFYFDEGGLVLLYRKYELCGAEAGFPEVRFRFEEIAGYLGEDALLLRLPYFDD